MATQQSPAVTYTWVPFMVELGQKLLAYETRQAELVDLLREAGVDKGLTDKDAEGKSIPLTEIDPFSFIAQIHKYRDWHNRLPILSKLKSRLGVTAELPEDFEGVPIPNPLRCWLFGWKADRAPGHIPQLWMLHRAVVAGQVASDEFDGALALPNVGKAMLTQAMFWVNPERYLPIDKQTKPYLEKAGIQPEFEDFAGYERILAEVRGKFPEKKFWELSYEAWSDRQHPPPNVKYWIYAPGRDAQHWDEFYEKGIMAIGWDQLGDLRKYPDKKAIAQALRELNNKPDSSKKNDATACYSFAREMRIGDVVFAKQGGSRILGHGIVASDYDFDDSREAYKHVRQMKWLKKGDWRVDEDSRFALKALTEVTPYSDFVSLIASKVGLDLGPRKQGTKVPPRLGGIAYWWLNANPKIWNFEDTPVGQKQTYTSHNEKGNKRVKYKYFQEVKPGDLVVGYVTSPQKEVVAVCTITQGLHQTDEGEEIEFEKIEQLARPIPYDTLQANPDLAASEPFINNQGSLFKLTEQEYEIIRSLIDETNIPPQTEIKLYTKQATMEGLFLSEAQFDEMLDALKEKKNLVLQGAPGVGKTYVAKRLAYALVGSNDPERVEMIQFHQSYSYEDFIQGFRPTPKGHFDLRYGVFHQFCRRAQREESQQKPYVFIIDEINRGNLSKIFGELMMLIEPDKRGKDYAIPLAYSHDADEKFFIPENLHLIGMMNTADRSLAMVDYALRRRFRFITLWPEFDSAAFQQFLAAAGAGEDLVRKIVERMAALNEAIAADTKNLGPGYRIGHSYFCPGKGITPDESWYRRVVESEIVPLIEEYWFDNEQKVQELRKALLA